MASFELDEREQKIYDEWDKQHLDEFHGGEEPYSGAIGGRITFSLTGTSLGTVLTATCAFCKAFKERKCDMSDYDNW